jgi:hypothetical protein
LAAFPFVDSILYILRRVPSSFSGPSADLFAKLFYFYFFPPPVDEKLMAHLLFFRDEKIDLAPADLLKSRGKTKAL